jgi:hypothetical protein
MKEKRRCLASKLGSFPDKKDQKNQRRRSKSGEGKTEFYEARLKD